MLQFECLPGLEFSQKYLSTCKFPTEVRFLAYYVAQIGELIG